VPLISYAVRAVLLVTLGIVIANILAETGIFSRLSSLTAPFCRLSGLSEASVLSIIAMAVNATAGKSMLAGYYQNGDLREEEVIPALIMGAFPVVLGESLFRVHLPVALVLLGPLVGGIYTGLNLFSSGIQGLFALLYEPIKSTIWLINSSLFFGSMRASDAPCQFIWFLPEIYQVC